MDGSLRVEWAFGALDDLNRIAAFLEEHHPPLAPLVAGALRDRAGLLAEHPQLGPALSEQTPYRRLIVRVLGATYGLDYRVDAQRVVILRAFHGREDH